MRKTKTTTITKQHKSERDSNTQIAKRIASCDVLRTQTHTFECENGRIYLYVEYIVGGVMVVLLLMKSINKLQQKNKTVK